MSKLKGIIPPLVTPLMSGYELDVEGLEKLIEHVLAGGVHGVFVLGTTGEAQSLSLRLRADLVRESARILDKRAPLLVGISDTSLESSLEFARIAKDAGADAVVSAPPYYFAIAQPELVDFYEQLVEQSPLPVFLYNMPTHTKINFAPSVIRRIAGHPNVIGFKDSSANGAYLQAVMYAMRERADFSIFVGAEEMMAEMVLMGASGGVNGGANLFPRLYVDLYNAAAAGDVKEAMRLQEIVMQINSTIYTQGLYGSSSLKGIKCALGLMGICSDVLASPLNRFDGLYKERVQAALNQVKF